MNWIKTAPRWLVWGLAFPILVLNGWLMLLVMDYFRSPVTIFISATILSFILDYPVRWLQRRRVPRLQAVFWVVLLVLSIVFILAITIVPIVIEQLDELINRLPSWLETGSQRLEAMQSWAIARRLPVDLSWVMLRLQDELSNQLQVFSSRILTFGLGLLGSAFELTLTMVVTFYLLLYGDRFWQGWFQWLPPPFNVRLRRSLRLHFHNYFIGQATLASLMAIFITVAFLVLQVPFGLLFGLAIGVMTLLPFGAVFSIWIISFLIGLNSLWLGVKVLFVALLIDQSIESGIAPRLLGRFTGLNPVWVLIALLLGVRIGGLLGLLIAVPTASFIKSIIDMLKISASESTVEDIELAP
ncbi:AI-2E family transporter [Oscillatoria sp. FACHB-1407]|uniref:AI-2E family transporter n=1 Tax=Oscillatoria sp. FACHB-1407 TaxID=2692847 RepID=UPI0016877344|nr:AI-2E family transporter [Oscillatoria sp. FACHB-1407]MBD2462971.1 AI-2E family transporter [Oscillatoria sp. FACHB-1407]